MTTEMSNFEQGKLAQLSELLVDNCDKLFDKFGLHFSKSSGMILGCCPIHGGDNKSAFNFYPDGHTIRGNWVCRTHNCHKTFKATIIGLVRGLLSAKHGWSDGETSKIYPWASTIKWCCEFLGIQWADVKISADYSEAKKFLSSANVLQKKRVTTQGIPREKIIRSLEIPAGFFLERGFAPELLKRYDIGLCRQSKNGFLGRVITPVYDDAGKNMVAYSGRTINGLCPKCESYHQTSSPCPKSEIRHLYSKWKHSEGINNYLFNFWNAKRFIKESGKVILVEGPLDVLKLEEYGIKNSVAIFGTDISEQQQIILEVSGCLSVILLLDMDEPGRVGCETIKAKLQNSYNLSCPLYSCHDPACMTKEQVIKLGVTS